MKRMLAQRPSSQKASKRIDRGVALIIAITVVIIWVVIVIGMIQLIPIWVTDWQGAHGHYPTGRMTYSAPKAWDTSTLTGITTDRVWWGVFDDQVSITSPSYSWTPQMERESS